MEHKINGWKKVNSRKIVSLYEATQILEHFNIDSSGFRVLDYFLKAQEIVNSNKDFTFEREVLNIVQED